MMVHDIDHVVARIQAIFDQEIRPRVPPTILDDPTFLESFVHNLKAIRRDVPMVQHKITDLILKNCVKALTHLKELTPRNFAPSGGPPKEPSGFVSQILAPLSGYLSGSGSALKSEARDAWALVVVVATTQQYNTILAERLKDTSRSEEQNNKLKAAGAKTKAVSALSSWAPILPNAFSSAGSSETETNMSIYDKMRLQCVLDVKCYKSEVSHFFPPPPPPPLFSSLLLLVFRLSNCYLFFAIVDSFFVQIVDQVQHSVRHAPTLLGTRGQHSTLRTPAVCCWTQLDFATNMSKEEKKTIAVKDVWGHSQSVIYLGDGYSSWYHHNLRRGQLSLFRHAPRFYFSH